MKEGDRICNKGKIVFYWVVDVLPKSILIIEDNPAILNNLAELLESRGYLPLIADNGYSGLQMAIAYQPDLILCDLHIGGLSGLQIAKTLRNRGNATPIVFQTADVKKEVLEELEGFGEVVYKPFSIDEIMGVVDKFLK